MATRKLQAETFNHKTAGNNVELGIWTPNLLHAMEALWSLSLPRQPLVDAAKLDFPSSKHLFAALYEGWRLRHLKDISANGYQQREQGEY